MLGAAVLTALLVRADARLVGPYFALSELVPASDSLTASNWYSSKTLRRALARRLLYPVLLGVVLAVLTEMPLWEIGSTGLVAAALLLWPLVFHGLPFGVSRRDWELPVLYFAFAASYGALAVGGALLVELARYASDGDMKRWLADQFLGGFATWVFVIFAVAVYRVTFARLTSKAQAREAIGREYDWEGNSSMLDQPPPGSP